MKIGFNCLLTAPQYSGGVNSFTFGLLDGFANVAGDHQLVILANWQNRSLFKKYEHRANIRVAEFNEATLTRVQRVYESLPWQIRRRPTTAHALNRILEWAYIEVAPTMMDICLVPYCPPVIFPFPTVPTVYALHDVQHLHFPDFFTREVIAERKANFAECLRHAAMVQASSRYMRDDFVRHLGGLTADKVVVIPEGVDIEFFQAPRSAPDIKARYKLPEAFLFLPAQLWPHKNHLTLLRALKRLREQNIEIPLVLTGQKYGAAESLFGFIEANGLGTQVFYLGVVPFEDVAALYQASRYLVMPSLYESSSMPVLEAAAAGTGIIASRIAPNEEMAETLEMDLFTPTDDGELAELLAAVWNSPTRARIEANQKNVEKFSWDNAARRYIDEFGSLVARCRSRQ